MEEDKKVAEKVGAGVGAALGAGGAIAGAGAAITAAGFGIAKSIKNKRKLEEENKRLKAELESKK